MRVSMSVREQNVEQDRILRLAALNVVELLQPFAGKEYGCRGVEHDVLREQRDSAAGDRYVARTRYKLEI